MAGSQPKTNPIFKKTLKVLGIILVTCTGLWLLVINPLLTRVERQRFEAAAISIRNFADELRIGTNVPTDTIEHRSCGYSSAKFSRGHRSCIVGFSLLFSNKNFEEANQIMQTIEKKINLGLVDRVRRGDELQDKFVSSVDQPKEQRFGATFDMEDCDDCSITIEYPNKPNPSNPFNEYPEEGFIIRIIYSDSARAEHYPVED